jgi:tryptophan synthase alpha subunit
MGYLNPFVRNGTGRTIKAIRASGVDGLIIPDIALGESDIVNNALRDNSLSLAQFVAPNTPMARMKMVDKAANSFVYVVSILGVTGGRAAMPSYLAKYLSTTSRMIKHPRFLGFGISGPKQVLMYKKYVDGVIIGSALVNIIKENNTPPKRINAIKRFIASIRAALD